MCQHIRSIRKGPTLSVIRFLQQSKRGEKPDFKTPPHFITYIEIVQGLRNYGAFMISKSLVRPIKIHNSNQHKSHQTLGPTTFLIQLLVPSPFLLSIRHQQNLAGIVETLPQTIYTIWRKSQFKHALEYILLYYSIQTFIMFSSFYKLQ